MGISEIKRQRLVDKGIELSVRGFCLEDVREILEEGLLETTNRKGEYASRRTIAGIIDNIMDQVDEELYLRGLY